MRALCLLLLLAFCACVDTRSVSLTFGEAGEGLDGFMCKDAMGKQLLDRRAPEAKASLIVDFVRLGGVPGCRVSQLISWCAAHDCKPIPGGRSCLPDIELPTGVSATPREELRGRLREAISRLSGAGVTPDAPDEFVLVRVVGTLQSCAEVEGSGDVLPALEPSKLLGCAYSCPVLLDRVDQDVYLGFDTLVGACEQGVRTCAAGDLRWQI